MTVQSCAPSRSVTIARKNYRDYKSELRHDFARRCGYCDDHDNTFGGVRGFHIDHFAPKSLFPELELQYSNLIYSCPFCNIAKSNKWFGANAKTSVVGDMGFIDPCAPEYSEHLKRNSEGQIFPATALGRNIIIHLKLYLLRHRLNWQVDRLQLLSVELAKISALARSRGIDTQGVDVVFGELILLTDEYTQRQNDT